MRHLTYEKIDGACFLEESGQELYTGAQVLFLGKIRDNPFDKKVAYLVYEAFDALAEKTIQDLTEQAFRKWPVIEARVLHRLGRVEVGEIAVAVDVRAVHRDEAYRASRFLIEAVKHKVPIWKKEYFADGSSAWSGCQHAPELQEAVS